jgi:hypothetical protein
LCIGLALLLGLIGPGCIKVSEQAIKAEPGGEVDVDYGGEAVKPTGEESSAELAMTTQAESMPEGWLQSLPQYPGSRLESVSEIDSAESRLLIVNLTTIELPDAVSSFYQEQAAAAGFTAAGSISTPGGSQEMYESADQVFTVICTEREGETLISLQLGPGE